MPIANVAPGRAPVLNASAPHPIRGSYVGIHSSGFRDFLLKSELLLAVTDCGFEHPSEGSVFSTI